MSQEKVLKTLESLGLAQFDAHVYVFLGKKGPQRARDIASALRMTKQQLYPALKNLQGKGIVNATLERPARFSAESFERVLDLFVKSKMEEAKRIQSNKTEILSDWQSITISENTDHIAKFSVLEGRNCIDSKLKQMVEETKNQLSLVTTVSGLVHADQFGLLDAASDRISKSKIHFRFLTQLSLQNTNTVKVLLKSCSKTELNLEGRTPDLGKLPNPMMIRDDEEVAFVINSSENEAEQLTNTCLWTNCKALVQSFSAVFEDSWQNSTDILKRIAEIETGKPAPRTCVINDAEAAMKTYDEALLRAKEEIIILTSSAGLLSINKKIEPVKKDARKNLLVKIMAPITLENLDAANELLKWCEIRHSPEGYLETTVIDRQHLFQFKNLPTKKNTLRSFQSFENTFYTSDTEYVEKVENMLNDIWKNTQIPHALPIQQKSVNQPISSDKPTHSGVYDEYKKEFKKIIGFTYSIEPQLGKITEEEVLNKIKNAKRMPAKDPQKDTIRLYGTTGTAIIYPPKNLNLPNFMVQVNHYNEQSSFGAGSSLMFDIQMNISENQSYLPAAFVTNNLEGFRFRKAMHASKHTTERLQFLKKDELKVQVQGNRLFAGWTVPIPLLPPKYVLPPTCIIIEGYGETKTYLTELKGHFDRRVTYEFNSLDAFVTFMHPTSKYYGPGSDAMLHREIIITGHPPSAWRERGVSTG